MLTAYSYKNNKKVVITKVWIGNLNELIRFKLMKKKLWNLNLFWETDIIALEYVGEIRNLQALT